MHNWIWDYRALSIYQQKIPKFNDNIIPWIFFKWFQKERIDTMEDEDNASKLQNEVAWCIDQLFQSINSGKLSERKGMDIRCKDIS